MIFRHNYPNGKEVSGLTLFGGLLALVILAAACDMPEQTEQTGQNEQMLLAAGDEDEEGFEPLFNGRDLTGWDGDDRFWSVQDGVIVGETSRENLAESNTFLIWEEQKPSDFELRFRIPI